MGTAVPDRPRAVVLLSGGLDSTTTFAVAKSQGFEVYALSVDYGQRHRVELERAAVIAKALGARVITTAGSDEKVQACRALGADLALNYKTQDVDRAIKDFAPQGINVWWESLREPNFERTIPLLAMRGRMIVMAGREARPVLPVGPFYTKDCSLHGFAMFNSSAEEQRHAAKDLNRWLAGGKLRARIDRVMPLSEAAAAHRLQEQSTIQKTSALSGKIVLKVLS